MNSHIFLFPFLVLAVVFVGIAFIANKPKWLVPAAPCLVVFLGGLMYLVYWWGPVHSNLIHSRSYQAKELDIKLPQGFKYIYAKPKNCEDWVYFHNDEYVLAVQYDNGEIYLLRR